MSVVCKIRETRLLDLRFRPLTVIAWPASNGGVNLAFCPTTRDRPLSHQHALSTLRTVAFVFAYHCGSTSKHVVPCAHTSTKRLDALRDHVTCT